MAQTAQQYLQSLPPAEQQQVNDSLKQSGSSIDQWYQAAIDAGDPRAVKASGGVQAEGADASQNYSTGGQADFKNAAPSSDWLGKRTPSPRELRRYAHDQGWSEDFNRYDDKQLANWLQTGGWDVNAGKFAGGVEKPTETGGQLAPNAMGGGGGGGGQGGGGMGGGQGGQGGIGGYMTNSGGYGGAPSFNPTPFTPPTYESAMADPGYQFALKQGADTLQNSAAARGVLRSSGTLKDLIGYGQDMAATQYGNAYNRAAQSYGLNYTAQKDAFAPLYGSWETQYGGNLQKYLQKENNIYGLINTPAPAAPTY